MTINRAFVHLTDVPIQTSLSRSEATVSFRFDSVRPLNGRLHQVPSDFRRFEFQLTPIYFYIMSVQPMIVK